VYVVRGSVAGVPAVADFGRGSASIVPGRPDSGLPPRGFGVFGTTTWKVPRPESGVGRPDEV
jgi:hypothetical protein